MQSRDRSAARDSVPADTDTYSEGGSTLQPPGGALSPSLTPSENRPAALVPARVLKYPVPMPDSDSRAYVSMPAGALILSVGIQGDQMVVWADVQSDGAVRERGTALRSLVVANTGRNIPLPRDARFVGTAISSNGIVWHVWDGGDV